jgi:hypothetical protein
VNFAESELGKKVPLSGAHYRGHLGTWVRTFYPHLGDRLVVEAFYISAHKNIYQAAIQLHATYQPTDLLSVTSYLAPLRINPVKVKNCPHLLSKFYRFFSLNKGFCFFAE